MALPAGTKLGPYEIIAPLGAGGIGEVYRARDTRLGRDVVLKFYLQHSPPIRSAWPAFSAKPCGTPEYSGGPKFEISSDGQRFLLVQKVGKEPPRIIVVDQNWFAEFATRKVN